MIAMVKSLYEDMIIYYVRVCIYCAAPSIRQAYDTIGKGITPVLSKIFLANVFFTFQLLLY